MDSYRHHRNVYSPSFKSDDGPENESDDDLPPLEDVPQNTTNSVDDDISEWKNIDDVDQFKQKTIKIPLKFDTSLFQDGTITYTKDGQYKIKLKLGKMTFDKPEGSDSTTLGVSYKIEEIKSHDTEDADEEVHDNNEIYVKI